MYLTGKVVVGSWLVSIVVHIAGLLVMFALVFPLTRDTKPDLPVTQAEILDNVKWSTFVPSNAPNPLKQPTQPDPLQKTYVPNEFTPLSELASNKKPDLSIIGIGAGGGDAAKYGLSAGGQQGPQFFGLGGSEHGARKIVYVVDRSGSMIDTFIHVGVELRRSISALRRSQKFHVIFFNSGEPLENPPRKLVSAIGAQKKQFFSFLKDVFPEGSTHPERAMRRALSLEPDLIYFLTDGEFDAGLIPKLDQWNSGRRVKIFTIAYFDPAGARLLNHIAQEHGGEFKFVSENDLP